MCHIFFTHSSVDGHLGCFCVLAIVNRAATNIAVHDSFELWYFQGICPVVGLLGRMVVLFLDFKEAPYCSPQWLCQFTYPPTVQEGSLFSTPSPAFSVCRYFDDGHSDQCEVIPHCSFDLDFSND